MTHRKRWTLGLFAGIGVGVCVAGLASLLMTGLDRAMLGTSAQPVVGPTLKMAEGSMSQGTTIGLFLLLSVVLIAIALGASAVDRGRAAGFASAPRHTRLRAVGVSRFLFQRQ